MSLSPEEINNLVEELTSVDPAGGYPDGYDGRVLDAIGAIIASDGDAYTDNECLGMIHQLVNHWSEVVDL